MKQNWIFQRGREVQMLNLQLHIQSHHKLKPLHLSTFIVTILPRAMLINMELFGCNFSQTYAIFLFASIP